MERILTMDEAFKELGDGEENEKDPAQFSNPKTIGKRFTMMQIFIRQFLVSALLISGFLLFKLMMPDLYEQVSDYLNIRFSILNLPW